MVVVAHAAETTGVAMRTILLFLALGFALFAAPAAILEGID